MGGNGREEKDVGVDRKRREEEEQEEGHETRK